MKLPKRNRGVPQAAGLILLVLVLAAAPCTAIAGGPPLAPPRQPWATNQRVFAIAKLGDTLFVGGNFTLAGPNTGSCAAIDRATGKLVPGFPRVAGNVRVLIPDDHGGWYVGGQIVGVGGLPRAGLAHVQADGSVADWNPAPDGQVEALELDGNNLYVAGYFNNIGGAVRAHVAAVDVRSGRATDWRADTDAPAHALMTFGSSLYVGGEFAHIGGQQRFGVAELALRSGKVTAWDPEIGSGGGGPGSVRTMARVGGTIYAGGTFWMAGAESRRNLAAVSAGSGKVSPWDPDVFDCNCNDYAPPASVFQLLPSGDGTMYVAGRFSLVHGEEHGGLVEVDLATGRPTAWDPHPGPSYYETAVEVDCIALGGERTLYIGSLTGSMGGAARNGFAEVDRRTGAATPWDPHADRGPAVLVVRGGLVYAGGQFGILGAQSRKSLAAFDVRTGELTDWNPAPDGIVDDMVAADGRVYVGGHFSRLGDQDRLDLAALDPATGVPLDWHADADGDVRKLVLDGDRLYLGGDFARVAGAGRLHVAAVSRTTGQLADWNPSANDGVWSIAPDGGTVYVAGYFRTIGGIPHAGLAAVDAVTGMARNWDPFSTLNYIAGIAVGESTLYVAGNFYVGYDRYLDGVETVDKTTGEVRGWATDFGGASTSSAYIYDLARLGNVLYAGGSFGPVAGVQRGGLAALDAATGRVLDWDPQLGADDDFIELRPGVVWRLCVDGSAVYAGGEISRVGAEPARNVVALAPASVPALARSSVGMSHTPDLALTIAPSPVRVGAAVRFSLSSAAPVTLTVFDARGRRVVALLERILESAGPHEIPIATSELPAGIYFCHLELPGASSTRKFVVLGQ